MATSSDLYCNICRLYFTSRLRFVEHSLSIQHHTVMEERGMRQHACELCSSPIYNFHAFVEHVRSSIHADKLSKLSSQFKEEQSAQSRGPLLLHPQSHPIPGQSHNRVMIPTPPQSHSFPSHSHPPPFNDPPPLSHPPSSNDTRVFFHSSQPFPPSCRPSSYNSPHTSSYRQSTHPQFSHSNPVCTTRPSLQSVSTKTQTVAPPIKPQTVAPPIKTQAVVIATKTQTVAPPIKPQTVAPPIKPQTVAPPIKPQTVAPPIKTQAVVIATKTQTVAPPIKTQTVAPPIKTQTVAPPIKTQAVTQPTKSQTVAPSTKFVASPAPPIKPQAAVLTPAKSQELTSSSKVVSSINSQTSVATATKSHTPAAIKNPPPPRATTSNTPSNNTPTTTHKIYKVLTHPPQQSSFTQTHPSPSPHSLPAKSYPSNKRSPLSNPPQDSSVSNQDELRRKILKHTEDQKAKQQETNQMKQKLHHYARRIIVPGDTTFEPPKKVNNTTTTSVPKVSSSASSVNIQSSTSTSGPPAGRIVHTGSSSSSDTVIISSPAPTVITDSLKSSPTNTTASINAPISSTSSSKTKTNVPVPDPIDMDTCTSPVSTSRKESISSTSPMGSNAVSAGLKRKNESPLTGSPVVKLSKLATSYSPHSGGSMATSRTESDTNKPVSKTSTGSSTVSTPKTSTGSSTVSTPKTSTGSSTVSTPKTSTGSSTVSSAPKTSTVSTPKTSIGSSTVAASNINTAGSSTVSTSKTSTGSSTVSTSKTSIGSSTVSASKTTGSSNVSIPKTSTGLSTYTVVMVEPAVKFSDINGHSEVADRCTSPIICVPPVAESTMTVSLSDLMKDIIEGARQLENISLSHLPTSEPQLSKEGKAVSSPPAALASKDLCHFKDKNGQKCSLPVVQGNKLCIDHLKEFENMMGKDVATNSTGKGRQGVAGFVGQSEKASSSVKSGKKKKVQNSTNLDSATASLPNPPSNTSSTSLNISGPNVNITGPNVNITGPNVNITGPSVNSGATGNGVAATGITIASSGSQNTIGTGNVSAVITGNTVTGSTSVEPTSASGAGKLSSSKERIGLHSSISELNAREEKVQKSLATAENSLTDVIRCIEELDALDYLSIQHGTKLQERLRETKVNYHQSVGQCNILSKKLLEESVPLQDKSKSSCSSDVETIEKLDKLHKEQVPMLLSLKELTTCYDKVLMSRVTMQSGYDGLLVRKEKLMKECEEHTKEYQEILGLKQTLILRKYSSKYISNPVKKEKLQADLETMDTGSLGNPGQDQLSRMTHLPQALLSSSSRCDSTSSSSVPSPLDPAVPLAESVFSPPPPPPPPIPSSVPIEGSSSSATLHKDTKRDGTEKEIATVKKKQQFDEEQLPLSKKRKGSQSFDAVSSASLIQARDIEQRQIETNQPMNEPQNTTDHQPQNTEQSHDTEQAQDQQGSEQPLGNDGPQQGSDVSPVKQPAETSIFTDHGNSVLAMKVHNNNLITCSMDKSVNIYNIETGRIVKKFMAYDRSVTCLEVYSNNNDTYILSGSNDKFIHMTDIETGRVSKFRCGSKLIYMVLHDPFLFIALSNGYINVMNVKDKSIVWKQQCHPSDKAISCLAVTNTHLFTAAFDFTVIAWDIYDFLSKGTTPKNFKMLYQFACFDNVVLSLLVNNNLLYCGSADHTLQIFDTRNWTRCHRITCHNGGISSIKIASNVLITSSFDKLIRCFDMETLELIQVYGGHSDRIYSMAVANGMIFTGSKDGSIKMFKLDLSNSFQCKWSDCYLKFGIQTHLLDHLKSHCTAASNGKKEKCLWNDCQILTSSMHEHLQTHLEQSNFF